MLLYGGGTGKDVGSDGRVVLKKGPWTAAEDEILAAYVRENGEGNWNAVQKNTGLARCGKSCRLRWANHLRPNLRKGSFTSEEERLIIQLHAQLGNKWARMAAQLPGRTDNEIKNYWNTRLKRLQRQRLPLYPPDIIPNHQLHPHQLQHHQQMYFQSQSSQPNTPSSSSSLPSPTPANANPSSSFTFYSTTASNANLLINPHTPTTPQTPSQLSSTPPPPPISSPLSSPHDNQYSRSSEIDTNFTFPRPPPLLQSPSSLFEKRYNNANTPFNCVSNSQFSPGSRDSYNSFYSSPTSQTATYHNANNNYSSSSLNPFPSSYPPLTSSPSFLLSHYNPSSSTSFHTNPVYSMKQDLSSNQIPHIKSFNNVHNLTDIEQQNHNLNGSNPHRRSVSCSLLEDILEETETLAGGGGDRPSKRRQLTTSLPNHHHQESNTSEDFFSVSFGQDSSDNLCSLQDLETEEEESLQMNTMQEDIAKLFDWESDSGEISNGHSSVLSDDNLVLDVHQFTSLFPPDSTATNDAHNNNFSWGDLHGHS